MNVWIDNSRAPVSGMVDVWFFEQAQDGSAYVYKWLGGDIAGWSSTLVDMGMGFPQDAALRMPHRWLEALVDAAVENRTGGRQLDAEVIEAFHLEQDRVSQLLDYITGTDVQ